MKLSKKGLIGVVMVLASLVVVSSAVAATKYESPAAIVTALTGKTVESVTAERQSTDKTYGAIASDAGKLEEFKVENLALKKDQIQSRVEAGTITQAQADEVVASLEKNQETCDGSGDQIMKNAGAGFGKGKAGSGTGAGKGMRRGAADGTGSGSCSGSCTVEQ